MRLATLVPGLLSVCSLLAAQDEPANHAPAVALEPAFPAQDKFDRPLLVEFHASDPDRAYVVTQAGHVFRVPRQGDKAERHVFLDVTNTIFVNDNWEEGLLGFAFDPTYEDNGFVYVYWTEKIEPRQEVMGDGRKARSNRQSVISRYRTRKGDHGPEVDPTSELRLLEVFQPFGNHNGGTIVFGPDGMLYVALGDGGAANDPFGNGQSLAVLLGKVLRIDVRGAGKEQPYRIPADNPFVGQDGKRGEIWCWGLRNPWRISFDRKTGELWCGDVGQNRIEEVDHLRKGGNYGWNLMEANEVFKGRKQDKPIPDDLIPPVATYERKDGVSITGGHVYRGKRIPQLDGWFVYADFGTFKLFACRTDRATDAPVLHLGRVPAAPSSFAEEPDGELLVTCFDGRVYRLVPAATKQ